MSIIVCCANCLHRIECSQLGRVRHEQMWTKCCNEWVEDGDPHE